jgi:hypothetical protein
LVLRQSYTLLEQETVSQDILHCRFWSSSMSFLLRIQSFAAFTSHLSKYYNNTVYWAFSLKVKDTELASSDDGDVIVMLDSEGGISFDMPVSIDNVISFMKGMKL